MSKHKKRRQHQQQRRLEKVQGDDAFAKVVDEFASARVVRPEAEIAQMLAADAGGVRSWSVNDLVPIADPAGPYLDEA